MLQLSSAQPLSVSASTATTSNPAQQSQQQQTLNQSSSSSSSNGPQQSTAQQTEDKRQIARRKRIDQIKDQLINGSEFYAMLTGLTDSQLLRNYGNLSSKQRPDAQQTLKQLRAAANRYSADGRSDKVETDEDAAKSDIIFAVLKERLQVLEQTHNTSSPARSTRSASNSKSRGSGQRRHAARKGR